ncbi:MAG: hypothetical protein ABJO88_13745 [Parasphingorhabdus sp.]
MERIADVGAYIRCWVVVRQAGFGAKINLAASQLPKHARVLQSGG